MKQIRIAWAPGLHPATEIGVEPYPGGKWEADTQQARLNLSALVTTGNEVCGPDTHWVEQRDTAHIQPFLRVIAGGRK